MTRLFVCILSVFVSLLPYSQSQECPGGVTPPGADPKWSTIPNRFELMAELHTVTGIMEIGQAFSTTRDSVFKLSVNGIYIESLNNQFACGFFCYFD